MQAATPLAAVFQFFVRDLAGMLGGVVFAFVQVGRYHTLLLFDASVSSPCTTGCPFTDGDVENKWHCNSVQGSDLDIYAKQVQRQLHLSSVILYRLTSALHLQETNCLLSWCSGVCLQTVSIMWVRHCFSPTVHACN